MNDATCLLKATCDTFIRTLEDIMKLTHSNTPTNLTGFEKAVGNAVQAKNDPSKLQGASSSKLHKHSLSRSQSQENR